ncbi:MAG: glycosyltransferase [Acidimicrobiales bacterium]|nr:glycosyltransferase [Acidimicrobiales bacterium]
MRIDQFVPSFVKHDAISSHVLQTRRALIEAGYQSRIYYEHIDRRLAGEAEPFDRCDPTPDPDRVILYQASTDSAMAAWLAEAARAGQRVAIYYHNITPSRYFARWEPRAARSMQTARGQLAELASSTGLALAASAYNEAELIELGYPQTSVCPLLIDLGDLHRPPDARALKRLRAVTGPRWLFVGRVAPNKCQHDVIAAFALYRRLYSPSARLSLVGAVTAPRYLRALEALVEELELGDSVDFVDSAPFPELLAHMHAADVFVCMSEHEGFCVPVIEAMELGLPVVAYGAAAVPETVGPAGMLVADKDPLAVAGSVHALLSSDRTRRETIDAGRDRAGRFALDRTSARLLSELARFTGPGFDPAAEVPSEVS